MHKEYTLVKTYNSSVWGIPISSLSIGSGHYEMINSDERISRLALFDPMMPYLYIPEADFIEIAGIFKSQYGAEICDQDLGYCVFNKNCDHITTLDDEVMNHTIYMTFPDEYANMTFESRRMFIRGSQIDSTDDKCFIPIFKHNENKVYWYFGNHFMRKYYFVYDMTPFDDRNEQKLQIAFGEATPYGLVTEGGNKEEDLKLINPTPNVDPFDLLLPPKPIPQEEIEAIKKVQL